MNFLQVLPLSACLFATIAYAGAVTAPFIDDLDAARKQAKAEHKDILVDFTGSDWCGWCITLDKEVFHTAEYKKGAPAHFVSVQLDFPQGTKLPAEVDARNKKWKKELKSRSFPDVLLLDENGKVYANTGYRAGGPKVYLEHMESMRQRRIQRDAAFVLAEKADGLEKARHLDAALSALRDDELLLAHYNDTIKQILALDSNDQAGLQKKYKALFRRQQCENEIHMLLTGNDGAAMLAKLKDYAAKADIPAESKQYALYMAGAVPCERKLHDYPQALELFKQAIAAAPDSPLVESKLKEAVARVEASMVRQKGKPGGQSSR